MKNSKLRALLKEVDASSVDDGSFVNLNMSVYLNHRGAVVEPDGACHANLSCSGNDTCAGNTYCSGNSSCSGNTACN